jgi:ElaB/YqjD/DUF883 family membrane-anchored ribosome-binding protein
MKLEKIRLENIKVDGDLQVRDKINEDAVREYADVIRGGGKMPPVTVFFDGKSYHLADGWHRYFGHKQAAFPEIEAEIHDGTRRDAILFALSANDKHGLRRTNADKRRSVLVILEDFEWSEWNNTKIAEVCGVSATFVDKIRKEMNTPEPVIRKVIRGGVEYEMDTSKMGRMFVSADRIPAEIPPVDEKEQKIEEMATEFQAIAEENEELKAKLAVKSMDASEEDKQSAQELIDELRATIKSQEAQIKGLTASRDAYQQKNAELLKQVNYWKKQVPKAA